MFRRRKGITLSDLPSYLAKGYGQGEGATYQPMIHVQDFPSKGWRNREFSMKTGRQHDYLSDHELNYHYILDWSKLVIDFREQFPLLPIEMTLGIAKQYGIHHPTDRNTGEPVVMTTDFLIILPQPIGHIRQARTIKPAKEVDRKRIIEKFEIERRYWLALGIHWAIVTEYEINIVLVKYLKWINKFFPLSSLAPLTEESVREIAIVLTQMQTKSNSCLSTIAMACDTQLGLKKGQSLAVARHLLASRQWRVDITKPFHPSEKFELLETSLVEIKRKE
jgi:hypothetical protein